MTGRQLNLGVQPEQTPRENDNYVRQEPIQQPMFTQNTTSMPYLPQNTQYQSLNYSRVTNTTVSNPQPVSQADMMRGYTIPYPTRTEPQNTNPEVLQMQNRGVNMTFNAPRPTFNAPMDQSLSMRGNLANLSHIVDRFPTDDRLLQGLQNSSYYTNKGLSHMLQTSSANSGALPMFSQPMYSRDIQQQSMSYTRPMTEGMRPMTEGMMPKSPVDSKKARKKSGKKPEAVVSSAAPSLQQGFQSYAGLKNTEPSAISLKTASVVPGSAFNFGPTATGLGLPTWGVGGDKDNYSGFLEEYRNPTNYFLAAAQRSSTENSSEKPVRQAHQQTTAPTPSFPFLGHPQPRAPSYPSLASPFINPHQAPPLMDPNSPLYQQYLHSAGVLHQGLLSPPAPYPPYPLGMRQPYDSMTRPSWL